MKIPQSGDVLNGRYRIEAVLGEGSFGVVVRATTLATGRRVALKILKPGERGYEPTSEARFMREMRMIAKLQCPNTLTLYDFGRTDAGLLYMVCEYVEGEDLLNLLNRRGKLLEHEALHIVYQVLLSLGEAHGRGLVHRDIKPQNIRIFNYEDDPLRVKVLDFGLARPFENDDARLTGTGRVVGTPRYMSPEQLFGIEVTPATDVYSLGLVACEMLLGRASTKLDDYRIPMRRGQIPAIEGVSDATRALIHRMTEPDADLRYSSAREALADVREIRTQGPRPEPPGNEDPTIHPEPRPTAPRPPAESPPPVRSASTLSESPSDPWRTAILAGLAALAFTIVAAIVLAVTERASDPPPPQPDASALPAPDVSAPRPPSHDAGPRVVEEAPREVVEQPSKASPGCGVAPPFVGHKTMRHLEGLTEVEWSLYVPQNYAPTRAHPVVILLHNDIQSGESFIARTRFTELADEKGIVLIAPNSRTQTPGSITAWRYPGSIEGITRSIDDASDLLCIDPHRLFAVAHSTGDWGADYLACAGLPLTAIASNSSRPWTTQPTCTPVRKIPRIILSPIDSKRLPRNGGKSCSSSIKHLSLKQLEQILRERNGCRGGSAKTFEHPSGTCFSWDCEKATTSCHVAGGVGWAGSGIAELDPLKCDPPISDFPTNRAIWEFFESVTPVTDQSH